MISLFTYERFLMALFTNTHPVFVSFLSQMKQIDKVNISSVCVVCQVFFVLIKSDFVRCFFYVFVFVRMCYNIGNWFGKGVIVMLVRRRLLFSCVMLFAVFVLLCQSVYASDLANGEVGGGEKQ